MTLGTSPLHSDGQRFRTGTTGTHTVKPTPLVPQKTQPRKIKRICSDSLAGLRPAPLFPEETSGARADLNNWEKRMARRGTHVQPHGHGTDEGSCKQQRVLGPQVGEVGRGVYTSCRHCRPWEQCNRGSTVSHVSYRCLAMSTGAA